mmetsp:Transcript_117163/g.303981  ORF Transcript_117163/g.303981 Transcript_117163/m.303981 type:complete len:737 (+) Transcript_117163:146-2356(+)
MMQLSKVLKITEAIESSELAEDDALPILRSAYPKRISAPFRLRTGAPPCCTRRSCLCNAPVPYDVKTKVVLPPPTPSVAWWGRRPRTREIRAGRSWPGSPGWDAGGRVRPLTAPGLGDSSIRPDRPDSGKPSVRPATTGCGMGKESRRTSNETKAAAEVDSLGVPLPRILRTRIAADEGITDGLQKRKTLMSQRAPLGDRLERMQLRMAQKIQDVRSKRMSEMRFKQFEALPAEEREAVCWAFDRCDTSGNGTLDLQGLVTSCWEMGLGGTGLEEKAEVYRICSEAGDEVDLHEFGVEVVPRVRERLGEMVSRELLRQFFQHDEDGDGYLSQAEFVDIARGMGLDAGMVWDSMEGEDKVNFEVFHSVICRSRERLQHSMRQHECEVKSMVGMDEETFQRCRQDLFVLFDLFHEYDLDNSGQLSITEVMFMIKEFGLMPKTRRERERVEHVLQEADKDGDGEFSFNEFLELVEQVRKMQQELRREEQLELFERYDRDRSGALSVAEISSLLSHLGVTPHSRAEQEELAELILSADDDGSGTIGFEEFQILCQRFEEKLNRLRFDEELDFGIAQGFTENQLRDFRYLFDMLDVDGSGKLDVQEVHSGLNIMQRPVSQEQVSKLFRKLDTDGSGEVDFSEFVELMRALKGEKEGIFDEPGLLVDTPKSLEVKTMRRAMERMKMPKSYLATFSKEELLDTFCRHFQVTPGTSLEGALGVRTVADLYTYAKEKKVVSLRRL